MCYYSATCALSDYIRGFMGKYLDDLDNKLKLTHQDDYSRYQYQSFMTGPEWRNVEMAEEFAQFLNDGNSYFFFPFFRQTAGLWRVFWHSFRAARQYNSFMEVATSEYMLMDLFVCIFTTMEMLPKGMMSLLLWPFLNKSNPTPMQQHLAEAAKKYAADLQTVPFYDHDYDSMRRDLAQKYQQCQPVSWVDWWSWKYVSLELFARKWISKPLQWIYSAVPEGKEGEEATPVTQVPPVTDAIVKLKLPGQVPEAEAKKAMTDKLSNILGVAVVDNHVFVKPTKEETNETSIYAYVRVPRYKAFIQTVKAMKEEDIHLRRIAGQDRIQIKCEQTASEQLTDEVPVAATKSDNEAKILYSYGDCLHANRRILMFDAPIKNLDQTLDKLESQDGTRIEFIHNF